MSSLTLNKPLQLERKTLSISSKRQITIPQKFYNALGFEQEAECLVRDNELIIRPIHKTSSEFAEEILQDLITEGYSGQELLTEFRKRQAKIGTAIQAILKDAHDAALGKGEFYTLTDILEKENLYQELQPYMHK